MPTEFKDKITDDDKKVIAEAVEVAKKVQKDEKAEKETIEQAVKDLNEAIMPIGAKMYENTADSGEASGEESDGGKKGDKKTKKDEPIEGEVVND